MFRLARRSPPLRARSLRRLALALPSCAAHHLVFETEIELTLVALHFFCFLLPEKKVRGKEGMPNLRKEEEERRKEGGDGAGMTFLLVLGAVAGTVAAVSVRDAAHRWSELAGGRPGFESEYSARGRVEVIAGLRARAPALHNPL